MSQNDKNQNSQDQARNLLARTAPRPIRSTKSTAADRGVDGDFEDAALDSMLAENADSLGQDKEFLSRVQAKLNSPRQPQVASTAKEPETFFGFSQSLLAEEPSEKLTQSVESAETNGVPLGKFVVMAVAAGLSCALIGGLLYWIGTGDSQNNTPLANNASSEANGSTGLTVEKGKSIAPRVPEMAKSKLQNPVSVPPKIVASELNAATDLGDSKLVPPPVVFEPELVEPDPVLPVLASTVKPTLPSMMENAVWQLDIRFDDKWKGTASINKEALNAAVPVRRIDVILARIGHEAARRVHYANPILDTDWIGSVSVSGPNFAFETRFENIDQMYDGIHNVRESVAKEVKKAAPMLAKFFSGTEIGFWSSDQLEFPVVLEATKTTEDLVLERMTASYSNKPESLRYKNYRAIGPNESARLRFGDKVEMPTALNMFADASIQNEDAASLVMDLDNATEINMFENRDEFVAAFDSVREDARLGEYRDFVRKERVEFSSLKKQLDKTTDVAIRKQIVKRMNWSSARSRKYKKLAFKDLNLHQPPKPVEPLEPLLAMLSIRPDLKSLPLIMGDDCHLDKSMAGTLSSVSSEVGRQLQVFDRFGSRNFEKHTEERVATVRKLIRGNAARGNSVQALRTLDQMLQIEKPILRIELVNALSQIQSEISCDLLSCYAKYDVDPSIRSAATNAMRTFPPEMVRKYLLKGFEYPWPEVAENSAEALVRLNDTDVIPDLVGLLELPDPRTPELNDDGKYFQREMVAVNHMKNCLLCHADSQNRSDPGRGVIPVWGQAPARVYYHGPSAGPAVRADITYLRQDFSVIRKVENAKPWPENQRFDYLVRLKGLSTAEANDIKNQLSKKPNIYRAAAAKALRRLTGLNPADDSYQTWISIVGVKAIRKVSQPN